MQITRFRVHHLRNLSEAELAPGSAFNLIYGANASGKTSLLEGIALLGLGTSFRTHQLDHVIQHGQESMVVYGLVAEDRSGNVVGLGVERTRGGNQRMRVGGQDVARRVDLTRRLPFVLLTADAHGLVEGGPTERRRYMDWGVFHVEHDYLGVWQRYRRILEQRNSALRRDCSDRELKVWDRELGESGEELNSYRVRYLTHLEMEFEKWKDLLSWKEWDALALSLKQGWRRDLPLAESLAQARANDRRRGFTSAGPHRAELTLSVCGRPVMQVLSRGQQKHLAYALRLAQASLLKEELGRLPVILIDDLSAEFDKDRQSLVLRALAQLGTQVFITSLDQELAESIPNPLPLALFHVKHGQVSAVVY